MSRVTSLRGPARQATLAVVFALACAVTEAAAQNVASASIQGSYTSGSILNYQGLSKIKKSPIKLIVGPWVHGGNVRSNSGDVEFGAAAAISDFNEAFHLRWFDHFLKGRQTGVDADPAVRLFVMGTGDGHKDANGRMFHGGYWRTASAWPLPETKLTSYYFHGDGTLSTTSAAAGEAPTKYTYDPAHPCRRSRSWSMSIRRARTISAGTR